MTDLEKNKEGLPQSVIDGVELITEGIKCGIATIPDDLYMLVKLAYLHGENHAYRKALNIEKEEH